MDIKRLLKELFDLNEEREWFEFKQNRFDQFDLIDIGKYVSALSNSAALTGKKYAYLIFGIKDQTHEIVGSNFNPYCNYKGEPYQHFLNRNLYPRIKFDFFEENINDKKVVVLQIEAANDVPTSFNGERFIRIGSSKISLKDNYKKEKELFKILNNGYPSITNTPSQYQDLTFTKLFMYYGSKGIKIKEETFKKNLQLLTDDGKYNMLAQLLSDNSHLPLGLSIFEGKTKDSNLYTVKEFGFDCLLYSLKNLIDYGDILNIIQADETNRKEERKEIPLFDIESYNEAIINAVLHNKWASGSEPMITVYSDRIEILSRGTIAPKQTMEGFYSGESIPVNEKLSEIFAQLRISDKSGRGVPKIVENYSKKAFDFREKSIVVTIPFNKHDQNKRMNIIKNADLIKLINHEIRSDQQLYSFFCHQLLTFTNNTHFLTLKSFCKIKKGIQIIEENRNGPYPIIACGLYPIGYYHKYNHEANTVTISCLGIVNFIKEKFYLNNDCFSVIPNDLMLPKFLYYCLKDQEQKITGIKRDPLPIVNVQLLSSLLIPCPSLDIQHYIVYALDKLDLFFKKKFLPETT